MFCELCGKPLAGEPPPVHVACAAAEASAPAGGTGPVHAVRTSTAPPPAASSGPPASVRIAWDGRPRSWPSVWSWISAGLFRNWRGVTAGLLCAWFNIPFVLLVGAVGGILGAVGGAVSGTAFADGILKRLNIFAEWIFPLPLDNGVADLLPTAAWQIGGVIGALWGAVSGAIHLGWIGLYWPWALLYDGDPSWPVMVFVGQIVTGLFFGVVYTVWTIAAEPWRLGIAGARAMSRREREWIMPLVHDCAARMRLGGLPRVLVTDSREVNAWAESRHIVIHKGLLSHLAHDREMVAGVIAHELAHWANGDPVARSFAKGVALPLYIMYEIATRLLNATNRIRPLQWLFRMLLWGVTTTVQGIVAPVQASAWRKEEYRADAAAAAAGYGEGLRSALSAFSDSFDSGRDGWDAVMFKSHPSYELRMERLETAGRDYPLVPGAAGLAGASSSTSSSLERGW